MQDYLFTVPATTATAACGGVKRRTLGIAKRRSPARAALKPAALVDSDEEAEVVLREDREQQQCAEPAGRPPGANLVPPTPSTVVPETVAIPVVPALCKRRGAEQPQPDAGEAMPTPEPAAKRARLGAALLSGCVMFVAPDIGDREQRAQWTQRIVDDGGRVVDALAGCDALMDG